MPLSSTQLLFILISAALLLVVARRWRIALLALQIHYIALGAMLLELGATTRGGLRILGGSLICAMLFLMARRLELDQADASGLVMGRRQAAEFVFRIAASGLVAIGVFGLPLAERFPSLPVELVQAWGWAMAIGAVIVLVSRQPLRISIGILTAVSGLTTLYTALDPRLLPAGLLALGEVLLALIVGVYLTPVRRKFLTRSGE